MALNNLTNFLNLIDLRRFKTTPELNDVIPLGTPDRKYDGGYKPTFIRWEDLLAAVDSGLTPGSDNTWDLPDTSFVDLSAIDPGQVGDGNKPYNTIAGANSSGATNIYLKPGIYSDFQVADGKTYYCAPGVILKDFRDDGISVTANILGDAVMDATFGFNVTGANTVINAEILESIGSSTVRADNGAEVYLKVKKGITCNGQNGGAFCSRIANGSTVTIETPYHYSNYWTGAFTGNGNYFNLKCPDIKILNEGVYGNIAKSLFNQQGGNTDNRLIIDLQGGKATTDVLVQTVSFGVLDSFVLTYVATATGSNHHFTIKNGTVYAGPIYGLTIYYQVRSGLVELESLNVLSDTIAFRTFHGNTAASGYLNFTATDCKFEGTLSNILGNNRIGDFLRCTFKVTDLTQTEIFTFNNGNPTDLPTYTFKGCYAELGNAGGGETLTGFSTATLGLLNTYSTEDLGVGAVDTWGGFTEVPTLTVTEIK